MASRSRWSIAAAAARAGARLLDVQRWRAQSHDQQLLAQAALPVDASSRAVLAVAKGHQDNITVVKLERAR